MPRKFFEDTGENGEREEREQCAAFDYKTEHQYSELQFHFFVVSLSEDYGDGGDTICNPPPDYCYIVPVINKPIVSRDSERNSTCCKEEADHCTINSCRHDIIRHQASLGSYTYRRREPFDNHP